MAQGESSNPARARLCINKLAPSVGHDYDKFRALTSPESNHRVQKPVTLNIHKILCKSFNLVNTILSIVALSPHDRAYFIFSLRINSRT